MQHASKTRSWMVGNSHGNSQVEVGRYTYGFEAMEVRQWGEGAHLTIGSFCSIAVNLIVMLGGNHRADWATTFPFGHIFQDELGGQDIVGHPHTKGDVVIGNDVWIGQNVTVMSGVTIADGAIIAANATVSRDVGPYELWAGNPARFVRTRFPSEIVAMLRDLRWWDCDPAVIREIAPLLSQAPTRERIEQIAARIAEARHA